MASPVPPLPEAAPTTDGYLHEICIYESDEEFRDLIVPFALEGLERGDPVVFAYDSYRTELLQQWLPASAGISFVDDAGPYSTPANALAGWRALVEGYLRSGASRVRIAGNVPHPGYGRPYAGWDRYEAAIDRAWGDLPVWAPCFYDARITPAEVLETASRRHRHLLARDATHRLNESFEPARRLADFLRMPADPLEKTRPTLELTGAAPARVRALVDQLAGHVLGVERRAELLLAASEAVANAHIHGEPPVTVRLWLGADRVVVVVHDMGTGPSDPLAGLLVSNDGDGESGRGLWLLHRLDLDAALFTTGGFTVRLRAPAEALTS